MKGPATCTIKLLPRDQWIRAAARAVEINPANAPKPARTGVVIPPERLAVLTTKYWGVGGVRLTVGFLDNPPADLRARILSHMNAWGIFCNVQFTETATNPQVRIARKAGDGYWSYLGTDVLSIAAGEPTMNLDSFTMNMTEAEFVRVVCHETGHTLGFPHEHRRKAIVDRIDRDKAIQYFGGPPNNWTPEKVIEQVLTPIENSALMATEQTDANSIMCYPLPASIMKDGIAVPGGDNIDALDARFAAMMYPLTVTGWPPPNLPPNYPMITHWGVFLRIDTSAGPLPKTSYNGSEVEVVRGGEALHRWHYSPNFGGGWFSWIWPVEDMTYHPKGYLVRIRVPSVNGVPTYTVIVNPETGAFVNDPSWTGTLNPRPPENPNYIKVGLRHPS